MAGLDAGSERKRVLVTGASGFVGSALAVELSHMFCVRAAYRRAPPQATDAAGVGELGPNTDWRRALEDVDAVVHLAGPAHSRYAPAIIERAIVDGTGALVEQAAAAGVKRFVFVSSIHACAKRTDGVALKEATPPNPTDAYGKAKLAAERLVLAREEVSPIVLRPPLIYDAHAKGNFARLVRLLDTAWPLPFGGIANKRNLISLASFNACVERTLRAPEVTGLFHVCDEAAVSTSEIAALLRQGMNRPARLFAAPGLSAIAPAPLTESLEIDGGRFRQAFGFAGVDTRDGLVSCGRLWAARR